MRRARLTTACTALTLSAALAAAPPAPKPGYAVGHVLTAAGKPITAPGAKIILAIDGVGTQTAQRLEYRVAVRPDGSYEQKLAEGTYHYFSAQVQVPFGGKSFLLPLDPVGDDKADRDSTQGIVQDYVWKVSGAKPGKGDETKPGDWYGAAVSLTYDAYRTDLHKSVPPPPAGSKCVFTLTPKGKLIDGSDGKPLTYTRPYSSLLSTLENGYLADVPVGAYTISGVEVGPDGAKKPLLFRQGNSAYAESLEFQFEPATSWAGTRSLGFTRSAN